MKIHEYQAKELFQKAGIPISHGRAAYDLNEARTIVQEIGFPAVLKSQVLVGGRGKAGGIKVVKTPQELEKTFPEIQNLKIKGYLPKCILIAKAIDIAREFYAAITVDNTKNDVVIIASCEGGVDIEETAQKSPSKIRKFYLNGKKEIDQARWPNFIKTVFEDATFQARGADIIKKILNLFYQNDCTLAEINPLAIDKKGEGHAVDAKMIFDDNALFRHPEIEALRDVAYEDADEVEAKSRGLSFVKLDGNIGCVVNGAGLAMATTDVIKMSGGEPANFLDVGGSSSPEKVLHALKIILSNTKIKAVLINIFGGITRCDDIAKGILEANQKLAIRVPFVVRLTGTNEKEAIEILSKEKIKIYSSMREAVLKVVELAK